jgi:hypothetical protein
VTVSVIAEPGRRIFNGSEGRRCYTKALVGAFSIAGALYCG